MPDHLASRFKYVTLPAVLATPVMIMVMENAALNAINPYLDAGESALEPAGRHRPLCGIRPAIRQNLRAGPL